MAIIGTWTNLKSSNVIFIVVYYFLGEIVPCAFLIFAIKPRLAAIGRAGPINSSETILLTPTTTLHRESSANLSRLANALQEPKVCHHPLKYDPPNTIHLPNTVSHEIPIVFKGRNTGLNRKNSFTTSRMSVKSVSKHAKRHNRNPSTSSSVTVTNTDSQDLSSAMIQEPSMYPSPPLWESLLK
jgi:hypothetical protein